MPINYTRTKPARNLILLAISFSIVVALVGFIWLAKSQNKSLARVGTNAPVSTGISIKFSEALSEPAKAVITYSDKKVVKEYPVVAGSTNFNIEVQPGIYSVQIIPKDKKQPPSPRIVVTVTEGVLREVSISSTTSE